MGKGKRQIRLTDELDALSVHTTKVNGWAATQPSITESERIAAWAIQELLEREAITLAQSLRHYDIRVCKPNPNLTVDDTELEDHLKNVKRIVITFE